MNHELAKLVTMRSYLVPRVQISDFAQDGEKK